jgi:HprK-related kinase B
VTVATESAESYAQALIGGADFVDRAVFLALGDRSVRIRANSSAMLDRLRRYFSTFVCAPAPADIDVLVVERDPVELGVEFIDWKREPGKSKRRKDSYRDFPGGRLVRKVRTGMLFLQSLDACVAAGPCLRNDNQVINFINSQYMNWLQQRGWLICHAAGIVCQGRALGIAGFSGGGKSTLMLHLLGNPGSAYLTNDRLFVKRAGDGMRAAGIPKLPRVNPGTILHNPQLHALIPADQRERLAQLPRDELWDLEQKYDVMVDEVYGQDRIVSEAPLAAFVILDWQRDDDAPLRVEQVDLARRHDLLQAVMKSPGPFYQYADGHMFEADATLGEQAYIDVFSDVAVYAVSGGLDFAGVVPHLEALMGCGHA